jgi:hypothetical protein
MTRGRIAGAVAFSSLPDLIALPFSGLGAFSRESGKVKD